MTTNDLKTLLTTHLTLDGGTSISKHLPDYSKDITKLLNSQRIKLLSFVELYPEDFICDRGKVPHVISLASYSDVGYTGNEFASALIIAAKILREKCLSLLQARLNKLRKRQNRDTLPSCLHENNDNGKDKDNENENDAAPMLWLCKQVKYELHLYLRLRSNNIIFYSPKLTGAMVGDCNWLEAAEARLYDFLELSSDCFTCIDGRVLSLRQCTVKCEAQTQATAQIQTSDLFATNEEGLFSLSAPRASKVMIGLLKSCLLKSINTNQRDHITPTTVVKKYKCIDMTAGLGSLTIQCSKQFDIVHAYEIDGGRYDLLVENCKAFGRGNIKCFLESCLIGIEREKEEDEEVVVAAVFDPPWGGIGYNKRTPIKFDNKPLDTVIISLLSKVRVIGIKLPLGYDAKTLSENVKMRSEGCIKCVLMRNVGRQFFVVLGIDELSE